MLILPFITLLFLDAILYRSRYQAGMPQIQKGKYLFPLFLWFLTKQSVKFSIFL